MARRRVLRWNLLNKSLCCFRIWRRSVRWTGTLLSNSWLRNVRNYAQLRTVRACTASWDSASAEGWNHAGAEQTLCNISQYFMLAVYPALSVIGTCWAHTEPLVKLWHSKCLWCGPGTAVGIATDYGLDGPGWHPNGNEIFCPTRPALWPIQPPVKWVPGLFRR